MAVASDLAGSVTVATLDAAGTPTVHDTISPLSSPHTVILRHLDLDPHVDLLVSEAGAGQISLWRNVGAPTYDFAAAGVLTTAGPPPSVFVAEDLDRDGCVLEQLRKALVDGGSVSGMLKDVALSPMFKKRAFR